MMVLERDKDYQETKGQTMTQVHQDTITAIATAPGRGGVGIIRVSGEKASQVARQVLAYLVSALGAVLHHLAVAN